MNNNTGMITKVAGPVVHAHLKGAINNLVRVGEEELLGEIIEVREDTCVIQVYEDTTGIAPGQPVIDTNQPLQVALGPGILGRVYDGTQRPLDLIKAQTGTFIARGVTAPPLDESTKWEFNPTIKNGTTVSEGSIIGEVKENATITHKIIVPVGIQGEISGLKKGKYTINDTIATVNDKPITLVQYWPVRKARPVRRSQPVRTPLISGTRVVDFLFPIAKGGAAAIPGPFGAGKTVTQQQFAKWCDADIIVYIGCGERGNEMTEVLEEFPHLIDPKSGEPLMNRTILIANTSNMPVAAREASVYTGITIAEYFRDQGYAVALMADSTSRWAEAMREISGRLEEMPGEEGYPAYLSKRLAEFYERAGPVETLGGERGSISIVGAVSPPGGDFSEPVTQNTLRLTRCFWALDAKLADKRHFPSFNWMQSYSLYDDQLSDWYTQHINPEWNTLRRRMKELLQEETELQEIAQLVGVDALPAHQQATLFIARIVREDFLQQNAFHEEDTFCPMQKQYFMAEAIFSFHDALLPQAEKTNMDKLRASSAASFISELKYTPNNQFETEKTRDALEKQLATKIKNSLAEART